ncbi:MarR family winged helix-turn-helix transcriptional regulator [Bradyrhizobium sp. CB2312]|uniref:MarR family winged helix-turn-helix transcriptional regulator n=1 Tax=Bradyrhizobium sp. CB2312 TaxID=3039155 RepID=UPI0024B1F2CD|nr:MarR family winged helix-turn-helix transcriptional regulator [Bradyrhizobium sp. CB2312]WFU72302.1 MarR family winged helix-turn-helix transcriptional regulator [Bradyrhizobium sp. CB2312]
MAEQDLPVVERNRCNCLALRKASRHMTLFYDAALEPSGLRSTQYALLTEIHRRGDAPPSIGDLAEALVMDQSTIGQNLRPLQRDGLVTLERDEADRRSRLAKLTPAGRSRLADARPLWLAAQEKFENGFGKRAAAELRNVLADIAGNQSLIANRQEKA